ncbi:HNH endonuclease [Rhodococcoides corynebacterioides]|uniref:HNH endonuclease n=1 Tax=Rhodococcoides corynebacterioides TaxID=53972 RepID=A0ABS7P7Z3_9NOCA|nr:HNH endonuclease [Rhodococcus corynebacterioides]MBY6368548.1 HNH endonuclease [Rhodococcus corynebacterioides]MBY6409483.1 HNH endonuclease [Rhodococcus corynebacterioides]
MTKHRPTALAGHRQTPPTDARSSPSAPWGAHTSSGHRALRSVTADPDHRDDLPAGDDSVPAWLSRRVLLLNATYEPLTALPMRRAVVLLVCEKATVVHDDDQGPLVRSVDLALQVPSVIRLRTYVRVPYRARIPMTRSALMHRDRFRCAYCGGKAETIDHVVPRSRGGGHSWENCVACCAPCNHRKADKLLSELGWTLRAALTPPTGPHWRLLAGIKELDPTWLPYLGEGAA